MSYSIRWPTVDGLSMRPKTVTKDDALPVTVEIHNHLPPGYGPSVTSFTPSPVTRTSRRDLLTNTAQPPESQGNMPSDENSDIQPLGDIVWDEERNENGLRLLDQFAGDPQYMGSLPGDAEYTAVDTDDGMQIFRYRGPEEGDGDLVAKLDPGNYIHRSDSNGFHLFKKSDDSVDPANTSANPDLDRPDNEMPVQGLDNPDDIATEGPSTLPFSSGTDDHCATLAAHNQYAARLWKGYQMTDSPASPWARFHEANKKLWGG